MTPRLRRRLGVFVGFAFMLPLLGLPSVSAAPIDDTRAEAARVQDPLAAQGEQVSIRAERYNRARSKVAEAEAGMAQTEADVARSDERLKLVKDRLAGAAVIAYVHGGSTSILSTMARSGRPNETIVRNQYLRVTAADQRAIIGELRLAKQDLSLRRTELDEERRAARAASDEAATASRQAQDAEATQRALLSSVEGDLSGLVAEEAARREAEEAAQRRLAVVIPPTAAATTAAPALVEGLATAAQPVVEPIAETVVPATRILPTSGLGAVAVERAMTHLGKPYEYGGSGPGSFDCSGLTQDAWAAAGVSLSHGADLQWYESTRVSVDEVIPGDLLFFGDSVEGIHHNAMYIGDGQMIEASQTGTPIRIRGWRSVDLVGAGRPG
ncbi:MAG TPA: NlpC/P60 family protein [Acidimicrobiales bacterium]|nr:NlpC/P60 family protein [Acidimicrobiales bacterium]